MVKKSPKILLKNAKIRYVASPFSTDSDDQDSLSVKLFQDQFPNSIETWEVEPCNWLYYNGLLRIKQKMPVHFLTVRVFSKVHVMR